MATKSDFAQKLLTDLRLRKEHMAVTQNSAHSSFVPADAYGNSKQVLKGSRETKMLQTLGPKIGSRSKSSSTSHKFPTTVQATNQIVPYGGEHSGERGDLSMALAYAFDNGGKLKRIDFTSSGKMMDFLKQIGQRSMQKSSNSQWPPTNQFPTLTHLHIDDIAKGAQKLNQILTACSDGLNIDKGTVEIGKELWKGALELEQSLRMLVSLQEASESMVSPRRKSRLKLLEEGDEGEDDNTSSKEKQKQIERPVFSFDKLSKNRKNNAQTSQQHNLMALTYLKENPNSKPQKQASTISTSMSHRRSASCGPELHTSQHTNSSKQKHDTGIPNVIAKLMGLEELSQKVNPKAAAERGNFSRQKSGDIVSTRTENPSSRGDEMKIEYTNEVQGEQNSKQRNKIAIVKYNERGLQQETFRLTYDYSYRATAHSHKSIRNEEEREATRNNVNESKAAISKMNELQSQITRLNRSSTSQMDIRKETGFSSTQRKQQEVKDETESNTQAMVPVKNQSSKAAEKVQAKRLGNMNDQTEKRATNKPPHLQQNPEKHESVWVPPGHEPQGKNLISEDRGQQRTNNKSQQRKTEAMSSKLNSQKVASYEKKLQMQPPIKNQNSTKENNAETMGVPVPKALSSRGQNNGTSNEGNISISDAKQESPMGPKSKQKSSSTDGVSGPQKTQVQVTADMDTKPAHVLARKVVDEIKPLKLASTTKTRVEKKAKTTARILKPHINLAEVSQTSKSKCKRTQIGRENAKPRAQESQQVDAGHRVTTNNLLTHEIQSQEKIAKPPQNENSQNIETSKDSGKQHTQETVPNEVQEVRPQRTATDISKGSNPCNLQPQQQRPTKTEKPQPLTEDETYLKQKLITSHLFLNTAEALFKLNIPIGILNYAIDQVCQGRDSKVILDCGYEVLKRKGRRQEIFLHPHINTFTSCRKVRSLDDLVRLMHKDIESLRSYGKNGTDRYDDADYILRMLERDIHYSYPDINCMWDLGWNELMFAYVEIDEVIRDMEHKILDELIDDMAKEYMLRLNFIAARI